MKSLYFRFGFVLAMVLLIGQGCFSLTPADGLSTTGPAGVFVSVDKGDNWQSISLLPTVDGVKDLSDVSVYRLFPDPQDPEALYWATRRNGFYFSYDEGRTWQQPRGGIDRGFIYSITVDPRDRCTLYITNGLQIMRSDDCSRSWEEVYRESRSDTKITSITFNPHNPEEIFMLESEGDLLKTTDEGKSWTVVHRFERDSADIFADNLQKDVFFVATRDSGIYRSIDGGETWVSLEENMSDFSGAHEYRRFYLHPTQRETLYWVSTYGILRSTNSGDTWESIDLITPPGSVQIYGFAVNPNNENELYYTATINNRSTFYRSVDGGINWTTKKLPSGQLPTLLYVHPEKEDIVYLGFTIPPSQ